MDLALLVYAISTIGNIQAFLWIAFVVCLGMAFVLAMTMTDFNSKPQEKEAYWKWAKRWVWVAAFIGLIQTVLPSEKTAYTMVGAYAAQKVAENEKVQQMSGKVLQIIEQKLDGFIEEGLEQAKKKVSK